MVLPQVWRCGPFGSGGALRRWSRAHATRLADGFAAGLAVWPFRVGCACVAGRGLTPRGSPMVLPQVWRCGPFGSGALASLVAGLRHAARRWFCRRFVGVALSGRVRLRRWSRAYATRLADGFAAGLSVWPFRVGCACVAGRGLTPRGSPMVLPQVCRCGPFGSGALASLVAGLRHAARRWSCRRFVGAALSGRVRLRRWSRAHATRLADGFAAGLSVWPFRVGCACVAGRGLTPRGSPMVRLLAAVDCH